MTASSFLFLVRRGLGIRLARVFPQVTCHIPAGLENPLLNLSAACDTQQQVGENNLEAPLFTPISQKWLMHIEKRW